MRASFRISFTDFIDDPGDDDCRRRATTVPADRMTFEDNYLILWIGDIQRIRFPMDTVRSVEIAHAPGSSRREDPDQLRARYPTSASRGAQLLSLYSAGQQDYEVLAAEFGRQPTAIRSRLARLGLEQL